MSKGFEYDMRCPMCGRVPHRDGICPLDRDYEALRMNEKDEPLDEEEILIKEGRFIKW